MNIKTESVKNIEVSIRAELWSTLDVVSNRIMQVYDSRKDKKKEKVLFLFAVSGSKQFCGLAEMTGKWNPDKIFEGFAPNSSGARNVG